MTHYLEDFPVGLRFDIGAKTVTEDEIIAFGRAYDNQLFHTDPVAALDTPFRGLVASGLHTFGIFSRLFTDAVMKDSAAVGGAGADGLRWTVPVRPLDTLHGFATVIAGTRESATKPDRGVLIVRGELVNQRGERVWVAEIATIVLKRPTT
jgi:acyl dehydratase